MATFKLKYVKSYIDVRGVRRHYFRRKGNPGGPLPGIPGSQEFMEAYAAFNSQKPKFAGKTPGTFGRIITDYYQTAQFTNLRPNSKALYRSALEPLAQNYGHNPASMLTQDRVIAMIEKIGVRAPQMANLTRDILLSVLRIAHSRGWIHRRIEGREIARYKGGTHHTWTSEEMAAYEARWPLGTRERLIYAMLLYTGQRGGDVIRMTRSEAKKGAFIVKQEKTGALVSIPVAGPLWEAIKAVPGHGITILGDRHGRPIQRRTMTKVLKQAAHLAGLSPACVPHGLRKALLTRLAEAGASSKQLASISGHRTTKELDRYTEAADQAALAESAMAKLLKPRTTGV